MSRLKKRSPIIYLNSLDTGWKMKAHFSHFIEQVIRKISPKLLMILRKPSQGSKPQLVTTSQGLRFFTNPKDILIDGVSDSLRNSQGWAPGETTLFQQIIRPGQTVVDVGANIGYFTVLARSLIGSTGKVFAYEPDDTNFSFLQKNVKLNFPNSKNITLIKAAVADAPGEATLYHSRYNKGDHRLHPFAEGYVDTQTTKQDSLDNYLKQIKIDVIKSDTQGYEGVVLSGMKKLLKRNKKIQLIMEFWPYGLTRAGSNPKEFLLQLYSYGFKLFIIDDASFHPIELKRVDISQFLGRISPKQGFITLYCTRYYPHFL